VWSVVYVVVVVVWLFSVCLVVWLLVCVFFFQAEDGIRDRDVTGVQTCALPISPPSAMTSSREGSRSSSRKAEMEGNAEGGGGEGAPAAPAASGAGRAGAQAEQEGRGRHQPKQGHRRMQVHRGDLLRAHRGRVDKVTQGRVGGVEQGVRLVPRQAQHRAQHGVQHKPPQQHPVRHRVRIGGRARREQNLQGTSRRKMAIPQSNLRALSPHPKEDHAHLPC